MENLDTKNIWVTKYKIAHRGLHNANLPENSLGAFENAMQKGFAIELDVRLTKDDKVVVFHDDDTLRVCGEKFVIRQTLYEDLKKLKLDSTDYNIPTLEQVLSLINKRVPIMIELKSASKKEQLEPKVYDIIKDYDGDIAIKSFNPISVLWFKKHAPHILRGMLSSYLEDINLPRIYKTIIKKLLLFKFVKPDFISYNFENLPNKYVSRKKVPVIAWTIRDEESQNQALNYASSVIFEGFIPENPLN